MIRLLTDFATKTVQAEFAKVASAYDATAAEVLQRAYSEPHRAYHDMRHIGEMLMALGLDGPFAKRPDLIVHAILWHDAVYITQNPDGSLRPDAVNVRESADLFLKHAIYLPEADRCAVEAMIMATAGHHPPTEDAPHYAGFARDCRLFLDLDLLRLAGDYETFRKNTAGIRQEFGWATDEMFAAGRPRAMQVFLDRTEIFTALSNRDALNRRARANIEKEIAFYQSPTPGHP